MTQPLRHLLSGIPVAWNERPFGPVLQERMDEGKTIAEIVAQAQDRLPPAFPLRGVVCINGHEIDRGVWHVVRPKPHGRIPVCVTLHLAPAQGGGSGGGSKGKSTLALVGSIALLVGTFWIGGGALAPVFGNLFAAGTLGARIAAAGFAIAGSLAVNALTPPPNAQASNAPVDDREPASISGNVLRPGGSIPRVVGTSKVFPPFAGEPLVEIVGDDEWIEAVAVLAGPHKIEDIRIGDTPVADMTGVTIETREGWQDDTPQTLVRRQSKSEQPQITLSAHRVNKAQQNLLDDQSNPASCVPEWHSVYSRNTPDEIWLTMLWPEGLYHGYFPAESIVMPVRYRIRKKGDVAWINLPEVHFTNRRAELIQKSVKLVWGDPVLPLPTPETAEAPLYAFSSVPGQVDPATAGWTADSYFYSGSGDTYYSSSNASTTGVRNMALYKDRVEFYLDPDTFPMGVYEIQAMRGSCYNQAYMTPSTYNYNNGSTTQIWDFFWYEFGGGFYAIHSSAANLRHKTLIGRVDNIWNESPIGNQGFALIAIRAKNRRLDQLSVLASGYVRDYNEETEQWDTWVVTSNPVPHYRDVLVGRENADPLPLDLLDNANLLSWRDYCVEQEYEVNAVCEGMTAVDAATMIASAGYARPRQSETWGVIIDRDRSAEAPVQVFTPLNMVNFRWTKAFARRPHALRARFKNFEDDFRDDEVIVPAPGYTLESATRFEEIDYRGLIYREDVEVRAAFDLAQADARTTFYSGEADLEALVCQRGSLVGVQYDTIAQFAGFSRIKSVIRDDGDQTLITGAILEGKIPTPTGGWFAETDTFFASADRFFAEPRAGVAIRCRDGSIEVAEVEVSEDETDEITFSEPIEDPDPVDEPRMKRGTMLASGPLGEEYRRMLVLDINRKKDLTASLTFVDEAPELFAA